MTVFFKSLRIKNFQAHRDLLLEFSDITSLIGPTDSGKSSIVRALSFVMFNTPNGTEFITHGEELTEVTLELADGTTITRRRGRKPTPNEYVINDSVTLKAFGTGVPEEVSKLLKLPPGAVQEQHESHFWVSLSPTSLGGELNRVIDLELIGTIMSSSTRKVRDAQAVYKNTKNEIEKQRTRLRHYEWARELGGDARRLRETRERYTQCRHRASVLRELLASLSVHAQRREKLSETLLEAQSAAQVGERWLEAARKARELSRLLVGVERLRRELTQKRERLAGLEDRLSQIPDICPTCKRPLEK